MDIDALLELLGLNPRPAAAKTDANGVYIQPEEERSQNRVDAQARILAARQPEPASDLMSILNRNRQSPEVAAEASTLLAPVREGFESANAPMEAQLQALEQEIASLERDQQARTQDVMGQNSRMRAMTPEMFTQPANARPDVVGQPMAGMPQLPRVPPAAANPFPPANPNQYAALERAGPPLQPAGTPPAQPLPARPSAPNLGPPQLQAFVDGSQSPVLPPGPINPPINGGPFQTPGPGNPLMEAFAQTAVPMQPSQRPPPTDTVPRLLRRNPPTFPFNRPSLAQPGPQVEGMPIIRGPQSPAPVQPPAPFTPSGEVIDWWNLGPRTAPPVSRPPRARQVAAQGPDQSTQLNQRELERLLSLPANQAPPASATQPTPQLASAPVQPPVPVPTGATPMSPPPAPRVNEQIPEALKTQLLNEAYRIVRDRQPQTLGAR